MSNFPNQKGRMHCPKRSSTSLKKKCFQVYENITVVPKTKANSTKIKKETFYRIKGTPLKMLNFDRVFKSEDDLEKNDNFWKKIQEEELKPVDCGLYLKGSSKSSEFSENINASYSDSTLKTCEVETEEVGLKPAWKELYHDLKNRGFDKVTLEPSGRCKMCKIIYPPNVPHEIEETPLDLDGVESLHRWIPQSLFSYNPRISDTSQISNFFALRVDRQKEIVDEKLKTGKYKEWRTRTLKRCDCSLTDCSCCSLSVGVFYKNETVSESNMQVLVSTTKMKPLI